MWRRTRPADSRPVRNRPALWEELHVRGWGVHTRSRETYRQVLLTLLCRTLSGAAALRSVRLAHRMREV
ncbi:hypothetical protein GCM10010341_68740 [Streptomyces noursei]|nr:hypothetical protein GCM10010341_68740 [Streptomyces noursei]